MQNKIKQRKQLDIKKTKKKVVIPRMKEPINIENQYYSYLLKYVKKMKELTDKYFLQEVEQAVLEAKMLVKQDSYTDKVLDALDKTQIEFDKEYPDLSIAKNAKYVGEETAAFQKRELNNLINKAVGVDIFFEDKALKDTIYAFTENNVALIKTIDSRYFNDIRQKVFTGIKDGVAFGDIKKDLLDSYGTSKWNAERIARDQVLNLYSQMNEYRQAEIGVDEYVWRGMKDQRERDKHLDREGKKYKWSDNSDIKPGQEILCRCYGEPVLDKFFKAQGIPYLRSI